MHIAHPPIVGAAELCVNENATLPLVEQSWRSNSARSGTSRADRRLLGFSRAITGPAQEAPFIGVRRHEENIASGYEPVGRQSRVLTEMHGVVEFTPSVEPPLIVRVSHVSCQFHDAWRMQKRGHKRHSRREKLPAVENATTTQCVVAVESEHEHGLEYRD